MADFDPSDERLADLDEPYYVTVTVGEDGKVLVATNCETTPDVRRLLAEALWDVAEDPEWGDLDAPTD